MQKLPQVEQMFETYPDGDDNRPHAILIKAYSNCNLPERAEQLVESMLRNECQRSLVDIEIINCLISAWANSSSSNPTVAANRAYQTYRWIFNHPICMQLKLQPIWTHILYYSTQWQKPDRIERFEMAIVRTTTLGIN